ncbi:hypothetical protein AB4125_07535 [Vibrio splendidus]
MYSYKNIPRCVEYTFQEQLLAQLLNRQSYDTWDDKLPGLPRGSRTERDKLKDKIKADLKLIQRGYCAYCGIRFMVRGGESHIHREHILAKNTERYRKFTFEPLNLALACSRCNGFDVKGTKDYVVYYNDLYPLISVSIIHPHLDNIESHLTSDNSVFVEPIDNSPKGIKTIIEFQLNEEAMLYLRGTYIKAKNIPVSDDDEELIDEIINREYM